MPRKSFTLLTSLFVGSLLALPAFAAPSKGEKVENPEYDSWARVKVGTVVVLKSSVKSGGTRTETIVSKKLVELTDDKAVIEITEQVNDKSADSSGESSVSNTVHVPRMVSPSKARMLVDPVGKISDTPATLSLLKPAKEFTTRKIESRKGEGGDKITTWICPDVPGMIVQKETTTGGKTLKLALSEIRSPKKKKSADEETASAAPAASGKPGEWMTDYKAAVELAKKEDKKLLLDFTGSDWCIWCKRLDGEVFTKKEFKKWAGDRFVLVKLDFPRSKKLPAKVKKQNEKLAKKHGVQGYPTIVILDAEERPVGKLGYAPGGPKEWIKLAEKELKNADSDDSDDDSADSNDSEKSDDSEN